MAGKWEAQAAEERRRRRKGDEEEGERGEDLEGECGPCSSEEVLETACPSLQKTVGGQGEEGSSVRDGGRRGASTAAAKTWKEEGSADAAGVPSCPPSAEESKKGSCGGGSAWTRGETSCRSRDRRSTGRRAGEEGSGERRSA